MNEINSTVSIHIEVPLNVQGTAALHHPIDLGVVGVLEVGPHWWCYSKDLPSHYKMGILWNSSTRKEVFFTSPDTLSSVICRLCNGSTAAVKNSSIPILPGHIGGGVITSILSIEILGNMQAYCASKAEVQYSYLLVTFPTKMPAICKHIAGIFLFWSDTYYQW